MPRFEPSQKYQNFVKTVRQRFNDWLSSAVEGEDNKERLGKAVNFLSGLIPMETGPEDLAMPMQISPVYHGSPYKFNKFKNEAIGSGEGAQAFGWGHYMTEAPEVASHYKNRATIFGLDPLEFNKKNPMPDNVISAARELGVDVNRASEWIAQHERDYDIRRIADSLSSYGPDNAKMMLKNSRQEKLFDELVKSGDLKVEGNIYEATLHKGKKPGEYEYLEWDKFIPVSQLNKLKLSAMQRFPSNDNPFYKGMVEILESKPSYRGENRGLSGQNLYKQISNLLGSDREASAFLKKSGIDGIKYPAGSLSGVKSDKFNYVVFDPEDITIEAVK